MSVWMKALGLSIACCLVVAFAVRSQPPANNTNQKNQPGNNQPGQNGPRFDAARFIKDHDKNGDGKLSKDELPPKLQDDFSKIDANGDGFITADELQKYAHKMAHRRPELVEVVLYAVDIEEPLTLKELQAAYDQLRKLDTNHDGKIDEAELKTYREQRKKERIDAIFDTLDKNKDGKISKDEARGFWADDFDKLDTNKDGFLEKNEVEAALKLHHDNANANNPQK